MRIHTKQGVSRGGHGTLQMYSVERLGRIRKAARKPRKRSSTKDGSLPGSILKKVSLFPYAVVNGRRGETA